MNKRLSVILSVWVLLGSTALTLGQVSNIHSTFLNDPTSQVAVSWRTPPWGSTAVEFGTTPALGSTATGTPFLSAGGYQHHVSLTGLQPDTTYYYKPVGAPATALSSFKTAPATNQHFRFAVVGDVQGYSTVSGRWTQASNFLAEQNILFWMPLGDLVQDGATQSEWDAFWTGAKNLSQSVPIAPVIGNHDRQGHPDGRPQLYLDQFRLPDSGTPDYQGYWYSLEVGSMLFTVLSNNPAGGPLSSDDARTIQVAWMDQVMGQSDARWTFASLHTPTYSTGGHGGQHLNSAFRPTWEAHGTAVVFSGHTHSFEVTHPIRDGELTGVYGEGTVYYNSAGINSNGGVSGAWFSEFWQTQNEYLVGIVDVFEDQIIVTTYDYRDGSVFHQITIPEPATMSLLGLGGLVALRRRR